ncbi:phage integrase N-terminal SAM-like domain-containing protein [Alkalihalobacillus oceani]|uniref:tyrosine-type recombinase/integrase n=1 Tax=Halalkalibacter oceani TaxID=1653776 RepID=UPI00203BB7CC|nr:phage integrase N-terminal SAM-like domain-containing protein [Halalkalibacter oceani]MCM3761347.1 phage integrase N-terminal SAM-like domain-containing protein [Halalkalibacter oceani]
MTTELAHYMEEYLQHLALRGRKPSTLKRYRYDLLDFCNWVRTTRADKLPLDQKEVSAAELELFFAELLEERRYHTRTIRRIHSVLRQVARYEASLGRSHLRPVLELEPPNLTELPLNEEEWLSAKEKKRLLHTLSSEHGLSAQQLETFPFYRERNQLIVVLMLKYGLSLREVHHLSIRDVKFETNDILVRYEEPLRRITLDDGDKQLAYRYFQTIPEPVRPCYHSADPFFVAFDFKRKTFHWSYDDDQPKRMTIIAIQKMLRIEVKRAGLRKGISAQTLRNTFILEQFRQGVTGDELISRIGYTSPLSLKRYLQTVEEMPQKQKEAASEG